MFLANTSNITNEHFRATEGREIESAEDITLINGEAN